MNLKNLKRFGLMLCLSVYSTLYADIAIFAGGCFWCTQLDVEKFDGIIETRVGFDGGLKPSPTYKQVAAGETNYVESVKIKFDPKKISYLELVKKFLRTVDVTQANGQFCDHGPQYRSVIFHINLSQKRDAELAIKSIKPLFNKVETVVMPSTQFYLAEDYHQHYAKKNPIRYKYYRWRCGRDEQLKKVWGNS